MIPGEWRSRWEWAVVEACPWWSEGTRARWERAVLSGPARWETSASEIGTYSGCVGVFGAVGIVSVVVVVVVVVGGDVRFLWRYGYLSGLGGWPSVKVTSGAYDVVIVGSSDS